MLNLADGVFILTTTIVVFFAMNRGSLQMVVTLAGTMLSVYAAYYSVVTTSWHFYALFLAGTALSIIIGSYLRARVDYTLPGKLDTVVSACLGVCAGIFFCVSIYTPFAGRFFSRQSALIASSWFNRNVVPCVERVIIPSQMFNIARYKELSLIEFTQCLGFRVEAEGNFIRKQSERRYKEAKDLQK